MFIGSNKFLQLDENTPNSTSIYEGYKELPDLEHAEEFCSKAEITVDYYIREFI